MAYGLLFLHHSGVGVEGPFDGVVADEGETVDGAGDRGIRVIRGMGVIGDDAGDEGFAADEGASEDDDAVARADGEGALGVDGDVGGEAADDGLVDAHLGGGYEGVG